MTGILDFKNDQITLCYTTGMSGKQKGEVSWGGLKSAHWGTSEVRR